MGFYPETGDDLLPVTRDVVALWRSQEKKRTEDDTLRKREEARGAPQPVDPNTYAPFDPQSGGPRVWYSRSDEGNYQFFDNPGYDPRTGEPLAVITRDVLNSWHNSLKRPDAQKCYIITQNLDMPVQYRDNPGLASVTGRQCRLVTPELIERLREYEKGNRPKRIEAAQPTFFDLRTGEPIVWYDKDKNGSIEIFDLMGYHPTTGDELLPITKEISSEWGEQQRKVPPRPPKSIQLGPDTVLFDPLTGAPLI